MAGQTKHGVAPLTRKKEIMQETDGEMRRLRSYHTGVKTKVGGVRMPVWKYEAIMAVFEKQGLSFSEGMERVADTQILRTR